MRKSFVMLALLGLTAFVSSAQAELLWDFWPQNANGWTVKSGFENYRTNDGGGVSPAVSAGAGYAMDTAHQTFLFESPVFHFDGSLLDGTNAMTWGSAGGAGDQSNKGAAFFADEAAVLAYNGGNTNDSGQKGLAFLNVDTNVYDAVLFNQGNGGTDNYSLTPAALTTAGVNLAGTYRLQYYENDHGGWGWGQLNYVNLGATAGASSDGTLVSALDGDWNAAATWTPDGDLTIPTAMTKVTVDGHTVDVNTAGFGTTLTLSSGTVNVNAPLTIQMSADVTGGTLNIGAGQTLTAGSLSNQGVTVLPAGAQLKIGGGTLAGITTASDNTFEGGATTTFLNLASGSTFIKTGAKTLAVTGASTIDATNTIRINAGELSVQATGDANPLGGAPLELDGGTFTGIAGMAGVVSGAKFVKILQNTNAGPLNIAEVQAFQLGTGTNVAPLGIATQSSTGSGGVASRANDGNTNQAWGGGSVAHTNGNVGEWWQVELADVTSIESVHFWGRNDCCQNRSDDFNLIISDSGNVELFNEQFTGIGSGPGANQLIQLAAPAELLDMTSTPISVLDNSGLNGSAPSVAWGPLAFNADGKTLTVDGGSASFVGTTLNHATAGIAANTDVVLGTITNPGSATVSVSGSGRLIFDDAGNSLGDVKPNINGGTLALTDVAGDGTTYDQPIAAGGDGTLAAGKFGAGADGPVAITLNDLNLNTGTLTLQTTDNYSLNLAGMTSSGGSIRFVPGANNVTLPATGNTLDLIIGGDVTNVVGLDTLTIGGTIKIRPSASVPAIDYPVDIGANTTEIGDDDVFDGEVTLSGMTSGATGNLRIVRSVTNVDDVASLTGGNIRFDQNNRDQIAVLQTNGDFTRNIGDAAGEVRWNQHGGLAAKGGPLTVTLEGGMNLLWDDANLGFNGKDLQFGSNTADDVVTLTNNIDMGSDHRRFQIADNPLTTNDKLVVSGNLTGGRSDKVFRFNENGGNSYSGPANADGNWRVTRASLTELTGTNTYNNYTWIDSGVVFAVDGVGIPTTSNMKFEADHGDWETIWLSNGTIERNIGGAGGDFGGATQGEIQWQGAGGGFAAKGGPLNVTLEGGVDLEWSSGDIGFNGNDKRLMLGSRYADDVVTFNNNINSTATDRCRYILLGDNPDTEEDYVVMAGNINVGEHFEIKYRGATVRKEAANFHMGTPENPTTITTGTGNHDLRFYDGVVLHYYTDLDTITREINFTNGSSANIHGDVRTIGTNGRLWVWGENGGNIRIDGNLTTARTGFYNGSTLELGLDGVSNGDLTLQGDGDQVLEIHNGSKVNIPGNFNNENRVYMQQPGSRLTVGGDVVNQGEIQLYQTDAIIDVAGDLTLGGRLRMGNGNQAGGGPGLGPNLNVAGALTMDNPGQEFGINWYGQVRTGAGSSVNCNTFWVQDAADVMIDGNVTVNGDYYQRNNGGGKVVITGELNKNGTGVAYFHHGSTLTVGGGGEFSAGNIQVGANGAGGTDIDMGDVNITSSGQMLFGWGGNPIFRTNGFLTMTAVDNVNAIQLERGLLSVAGPVTAHGINLDGRAGGTFEPGSTVTLVDQLLVQGTATLSPGAGVADVAISATQLNFMNGTSYKWELGPGGVADGAGIGYDTIDLVTGTKLTAEGTFNLVIGSDGYGNGADTDVFTLVTYDPATVDATNVPAGDLPIAVSLATDAPSWWDASGATVSHDAVTGTVTMTGLVAPGATVSADTGAWNETASWDTGVPSDSRATIIQDTHAITLGSAASSPIYTQVLTGGSLVVADGGSLASATTNVAGTLSVDGTLTATTLDVSGTTTVGSTANMAVDTINVTGGTLSVSAPVTATAVNLGVGSSLEVSANITATDTLAINGDINATGDVTLSGDAISVGNKPTVNVSGNLIINAIGGFDNVTLNQVAFRFFAGQNDTILRLDDGIDGNGTNGGLYGMTETDYASLPGFFKDRSNEEGIWTDAVQVAGNPSDGYVAFWEGTFIAPTTKTYEFYVHGDDQEALWIDMDQDGEFDEATDLITQNFAPENWDTPKTSTVDLVAGQAYPFAIGFMEGAGGDFMDFRIDGVQVNPSDAAQGGWWGVGGPITTFGTVNLTAGSTFSVSEAVAIRTVNADAGAGLAGSITVASALTPLADGIADLTVTGDLTLSDGMTYNWEMGAGLADTDLVNISGDLTLGEVNLLITDLGLVAAFDEEAKLSLMTYEGVLIGGMSAGLEYDLNYDGAVDDADLNMLLTDINNGADPANLAGLMANFGLTSEAEADPSLLNNFTVDLGTTGWVGTPEVRVENLGGGVAQIYLTGVASDAATAAVPEPSAIVLLLLGGLGVLPIIRRRKRR